MSETAAATSAGSSIEDRLLTVIESQSSVISQLLQLINGELATIAADQKQNMATLTGTLATVLHNQEEMMSEQSQVDTDVAAITAADQAEAASIADIASQLVSIQADFAAAVAAGQQPDLSKLDALVAQVQSTQAAAGTADTSAQADTTADAPGPTPTPAPTPDAPPAS